MYEYEQYYDQKSNAYRIPGHMKPLCPWCNNLLHDGLNQCTSCGHWVNVCTMDIQGHISYSITKETDCDEHDGVADRNAQELL